ncbi:MAG: B12-binding domain-containing radical SAM protein [Candidatus Rokubacteria bacterium]|nr:B12-binding domain-containing radical SAM protein [Candidatus Rokubacteria bacterium]
MSWRLKKKAQELRAGEDGIVHKDWGGRVSVALAYPNTYAVGMSNLGFQAIYTHLNLLPDVVCERVFFPDPEDVEEYLRTGTAPFSFESLRPLADFDLVGFSVTYEGDYINLVRLLRMAGIPARPEARGPRDPVVMMGGVCAFSNPEPIAPFMDFVVVGEGEEVVGEIIAAWRAADVRADEDGRGRLRARLAPITGIYLPEAYDVTYASDGTIAGVRPARPEVPPIVVKRRLADVNRFETISTVKSPRAEYGHMQLLEVGKGCGRGCRFCLEGQIYRPVRHRSLESLRESVDRIARDSKRVGLVGACVSDYPWIGDLMRLLEERGVEVSISSLRADSLTEDLVAALGRGGHRTLTMAPEAGTERLRQVVRKVISDEQLLTACELLRRHGIPNLKCYFMIGLPTETAEDAEAIPALAARMLERLQVPGSDGRPFGKLTLSVSTFVPKPWTPFQWAPFDDLRSLEAKLEAIKRGARRLPNVRVLHENPREASLQALLARGDRRVADLVDLAARLDGDWRRALREWDGDAAFYTRRRRGEDEIMPWDHLDVAVKKAGLRREWQRALSPPPEPVPAGVAGEAEGAPPWPG